MATRNINSLANAQVIGYGDLPIARSAANRIIIGTAGPVIGTGGLLLQSADTVGWSDGAISRAAANSLSMNASLTLVGGTRTTSVPLINGTQTWSDALVAFTAATINVTDTASAAGSLLLDLRVGGTSLFAVSSKGGAVQRLFFTYDGSGAVITHMNNQGIYFKANAGGYYGGFSSSGLSIGGTLGSGATLIGEANNVLALRNGTNAQCINVYGTSSSGNAVYERLALRYSTANSRFEIATEHAGATARPLAFMVAGTLAASIATTGIVTWTNDQAYGGGAQLSWSTRGVLRWTDAGVFRISDITSADLNRVCWGGTTASYPSWKRSTTILQARLADDSDFCTVQGIHRTHANAVAETPTATHTLAFVDASGTVYKLLAVAA